MRRSTRATSETSTTELLESLFKYQELWRRALRTEDIPAANGYAGKVWVAAETLSQERDGRQALEGLLDSPAADIRLRGAQEVIQWSPDKAIPVLGRLTFEELGIDLSPDERVEIRSSAKSSLYRFFGISSFDRNDLIEPLREYGVDIPFDDHARWR